MKDPQALAVAPNGGILIDSQVSDQIFERESNGAFRVIAGNGRVGLAGDGGPASQAELQGPVAIAVGADGTIYIADLGNNRIRAVSPAGIITTLAQVSQPGALAVGPNGTVYVVDSAGIQSVGPGGTVQTVIAPQSGPTPEGPSFDISIGGIPVAFDPDAIAISATGDIYVANFSPKLILQFPPGRPPSLVGQESLEIGIYGVPAGLATAPDGSIVLADYGNFAVDRITGSSVSVVKAFTVGGITGIKGILQPSGVAVASNGEIYADPDGASGASNATALIAIDPNGDVHVLDTGSPANR